MGGKRDKRTIHNTLITIGVWNVNIFYLTAPIPILHNLSYDIPPNKGVNDIAFVVGTRAEKETNKQSLIF